MVNRLEKISAFIFPYLIFLSLGLVYFFFKDHGDLVLWFDQNHTSFLNYFFKYWTHTGDWFFIVVVVLLVIYVRFRQGMILGLGMIVQAGIVLLLKYLLFDNTPRPKTYFEGERVLDLIEGVKIQDFNSFPSGHSVASFTLALFVALFIGSRKYSFLLFIGALLTGLSRIYLGHHFLIDVLVGSLIGTLVALITYFLFEKYLNEEKAVLEDAPNDDLAKMNLNTDDVTDSVS